MGNHCVTMPPVSTTHNKAGQLGHLDTYIGTGQTHMETCTRTNVHMHTHTHTHTTIPG